VLAATLFGPRVSMIRRLEKTQVPIGRRRHTPPKSGAINLADMHATSTPASRQKITNVRLWHIPAIVRCGRTVYHIKIVRQPENSFSLRPRPLAACAVRRVGWCAKVSLTVAPTKPTETLAVVNLVGSARPSPFVS
jgi:hypothetical protein